MRTNLGARQSSPSRRSVGTGKLLSTKLVRDPRSPSTGDLVTPHLRLDNGVWRLSSRVSHWAAWSHADTCDALAAAWRSPLFRSNTLTDLLDNGAHALSNGSNAADALASSQPINERDEPLERETVENW